MNILSRTLSELENAFHRLESKNERPVLVSLGPYKVFRYPSNSVENATILKLARIISGLHALCVLLDAGLLQELGAVKRMLDEFGEDVIFLCQAIRSRVITPLHQEYLDYFYQEEFDIPESPLASTQKRSSVPRRKILAAISAAPERAINPHDGQEVHRTINKAYSGYVHGNACHVLEMYGGSPPRFHLFGQQGTRLQMSAADGAVHYLYRGLLSVHLAALSFGDDELTRHLLAFRSEFEREMQMEFPKDIEERIRAMKNPVK